MSEEVTIGSCLLGTRRYNFNPLHRDPKRHDAQRYRRTDRHYDATADQYDQLIKSSEIMISEYASLLNVLCRSDNMAYVVSR